MPKKTTLTKEQIKHIKEYGFLYYQYTEKELRESIGINSKKHRDNGKISPINWEDVFKHIFYFASDYSIDFLREARTNAIEYSRKKRKKSLERTIKENNRWTTQLILEHVRSSLHMDLYDDKQCLQCIKVWDLIRNGFFDEFIHFSDVMTD